MGKNRKLEDERKRKRGDGQNLKSKDERKRKGMLMLFVLLFIFGSFLLLSIASTPNYSLSNLTKKKSEKISLEIADNEFSRMRGLMFREKIIPILFIFDYEGKFPIHSHFVKAEFDAIYVSRDGTVMEVFRRIPPEQDRISPQKDASFLLELPPELTDRLKIEVGDKVEWKKLR